jgi:hypothetical protein
MKEEEVEEVMRKQGKVVRAPVTSLKFATVVLR